MSPLPLPLQRASELSIVIPSRCEEFLSETIDDILKHSEADTEVIVALDGEWPIKPLPDNPKVIVIHYSESVGQRAATNDCVSLSRAKYIMKVDAHCSFDQGFDRKMLEAFKETGDNVTMVPLMRNLHAFDWVCKNGHRRYQGKSGVCEECQEPTEKDICWIGKRNPKSTAYCFDSEPHFQYHKEHKRKQHGDIVETMSLQGSCFMLIRDKYWKLKVCDEEFGSWGSQGIEVACKTWLTGGRVLCNKNTWYSHMFRTQGGDFGFPYKQSGRQVKRAKQHAKAVFLEAKIPNQTRDIAWLVEKFWPYGTRKDGKAMWSEDDLIAIGGKVPEKVPTKGILYYTDNRCNIKLAKTVRKYLKESGLPITSVSLKPMPWFGHNIHIKEKRSILTMTKQILVGLEVMKEDIIFFCEHDVLYPKENFDFTPPKTDVFYYNGNYWMVRMEDGFAINYNVSPLSGLCAYREPLIQHYKERLALIEKEGFSLKIGYEPMTHKRIKWKHRYNFELYMPSVPSIDVTHGQNASPKRWKIKQFRKKPTFWNEADVDNIAEWPNLREILDIKA